jgi:hypothetical protein
VKTQLQRHVEAGQATGDLDAREVVDKIGEPNLHNGVLTIDQGKTEGGEEGISKYQCI